MSKKNMFKVVFYNHGKIYEVYAKDVVQSNMFGFIEIENIVFGEKSSLVIDPAEERLKEEFKGVKRTYIPVNAIVRIDEVEKEGTAKILNIEGDRNQVVNFPGSSYNNKLPKPDDDK